MRERLSGMSPANWKPSNQVDRMKKRISTIVNELGFATTDEIALVLRELSGDVKKKTLSSKLKELVEEGTLLGVLPGENSYGMDGYVAGSDLETRDVFEIKKQIVDSGLSKRDLESVDWKLLSSRMLDRLIEDISGLQDELEKMYKDPKELELMYFDLSLAYHRLYGFFFDKNAVNFPEALEKVLKDCREVIERKEF